VADSDFSLESVSRLNQSAGRAGVPLFGCVTTGEVWQFLKLAGPEALMDRRRHDIDNLGKILGVFRTIAAEILPAG